MFEAFERRRKSAPIWHVFQPDQVEAGFHLAQRNCLACVCQNLNGVQLTEKRILTKSRRKLSWQLLLPSWGSDLSVINKYLQINKYVCVYRHTWVRTHTYTYGERKRFILRNCLMRSWGRVSPKSAGQAGVLGLQGRVIFQMWRQSNGISPCTGQASLFSIKSFRLCETHPP